MGIDKIFSGDNSREFWREINSLDATSTGDDIRDVLFLFGCKLQEYELKVDIQIAALQAIEVNDE
jgi:hypothetical protein